MTASSKISKQHVQGSSTTSTWFKSWRDPPYLLMNSWNHEGEWTIFRLFQCFPSWVKQNNSSKLLEKLEQEIEEESSLGWRMELIFLIFMTQRLENTKNQLGRRRSTIELHSLKFEFMQNEGIKAPKDFFSHKDQ